ncbi:MAG: hypothetical protein AB7N80_02780 [Bdellovibrionales bacterium]
MELRNINFLSLLWFTIFILGCGHYKKMPEVNHNFEKQVETKVYRGGEFGFLFEGHEYSFISEFIEQGEYNCHFYLGYKDKQLAYTFPYNLAAEKLKKVYSAEIGIEEKIKQVVAISEAQHSQKNECSKEIGQKNESVAENVMAIVAYSPILAIAIPIVPVMLIEGYREHAKETELAKKLRQVRLGLTNEQVNEIMGSSYTEAKSYPFSIQQFRELKRNLVFVYKNKKLIAYIWGYE